MSVLILTQKPDTPARRWDAMRAPGRPAGRVGGGWIADLTAVKQAVILCEFCAHKFNPRRHGYERWRHEMWANATCDDCKRRTPRAVVFIHESTHNQVGDPSFHRPCKGRWFGWVPRSWRI